MRAWVCLVLVLAACEDTRRAPRRHRHDDDEPAQLTEAMRAPAAAPPARARCVGGDDCLPDLSFVDAAGQIHTPSDFVDKVVVLSFWASWSKPSQREIPVISDVAGAFGSLVVVLGVSIESISSGELEDQRSLLDMRYPAVSMASLGYAFTPPDTVPTTWIYDRDGRRVTVHVGGYDETSLREDLLRLVSVP